MRPLIVIAVCFSLVGCGKNDSAKTGVKDSDLAEIAANAHRLKQSADPKEKELGKSLEDFLALAPDPKLPLWSADNLGWDTNKASQLLAYQHELQQKPPFYAGRAPLIYTQYQSPLGTVLIQEFGDFRTFFKLNAGGTLIGARTVGKDGGLLAAARLQYYVKGNVQGRELEEFHYDGSGKITFKCKSDLDPNTGFKVKESEKSGRKGRDFYFLWPIR